MKFSHYNIQVDSSGHDQQLVKCPQCSHLRKKSYLKTLSVNISEKIWNCHHCGWSGSLNEFRPTDNFKYKRMIKKTYKSPEQPKTFTLPDKVFKWFQDRGLSQKTLIESRISHEQAWMPQTKKNESCVVFNYYSNDNLINRKYRDGKKNMKLSKDARLILYAPHPYACELAEKIYICEGEIDALTLMELEFNAVMSTPNGAPDIKTEIEKADLSYLETIEELAPKYKQVVLVMDNDKVGVRLRDEIARRIGIEKCLKVDYPSDCKDINDVLVKHGKEKALEVVNSSAHFPIAGKYRVGDFYDKMFEIYDNGIQGGVSTGWVGIDEFYTIKKKQFSVVTGVPSHGKSSFIDALMMNMAKYHGWKFAIYSPENFPFEEHISKFCELYVGKGFHKTAINRISEDELAQAIAFLDRHFYFIMPEKDAASMEDILDLCKKVVFRRGVDGIVIDPWNEIEHNRGRMSETDYASKALSQVRKFCRLSDVHTWLVAHPAKIQKDKNGNYPVARPYDISGSAHFNNKADCCLCVHRSYDDNSTTIYIQKIRFKNIGKIGKVKMSFNLLNNRYKPYDVYDQIQNQSADS